MTGQGARPGQAAIHHRDGTTAAYGLADGFVLGPAAKEEGRAMRNALLWLAMALVALWALAWLVFRLANLAVHLVLLLALAMAVFWLLQRLRA
jgi:hypothetical protein